MSKNELLKLIEMGLVDRNKENMEFLLDLSDADVEVLLKNKDNARKMFKLMVKFKDYPKYSWRKFSGFEAMTLDVLINIVDDENLRNSLYFENVFDRALNMNGDKLRYFANIVTNDGMISLKEYSLFVRKLAKKDLNF